MLFHDTWSTGLSHVTVDGRSVRVDTPARQQGTGKPCLTLAKLAVTCESGVTATVEVSINMRFADWNRPTLDNPTVFINATPSSCDNQLAMFLGMDGLQLRRFRAHRLASNARLADIARQVYGEFVGL